MTVAAVAMTYYVVFRPHDGFHGYSWWWTIGHDHAVSEYFIGTVLGALIYFGGLGCALLLGVRSLFPSGEKLHCDRSQLTVSKIPWISFRGRWTTHVFSLAQVSEMKYGLIRRGTARDPSIYGILFLVDGNRRKILRRIGAPEAARLLRGIKKLGLDVPHDPDILPRMQMALEDRRSKP
ncbi:MAG TPA: hypothetical protein VGI16_08510 [Candidatus Acidoferrum sp.]